MNAKVIALPKRDFNFNWSYYQTTIGKKRFEFFRALAWEKTQIRHDLPPLLSRMTPFQSVFWSSLYFLLALLFAWFSRFYLCLFLFSFAFLSPYSAHFGFLSNFMAGFSRLALRLLLTAFFGRSVSFYPAYFHSNPLSTNLSNNFLPLTKL